MGVATSSPHAQVIMGNAQARRRIKAFKIAFPERPEDKVIKLADEMANKNDEISMANMLILFYLFCSGKMEDNLVHIFNLFDQDGNKVITIDELLSLMSVFIEIGEGKDHKVDLATVMAEMYRKGDADKNEKLELNEFVEGMMSHPVTSKIIGIKTIDALLEMFS